MKKLSFVIPCYKSEKTIENVINRIIQTVNIDGRYDYEIICVNDASPDGTYAVLRKIALNNRQIKVIDLSRNFGQHAALMAGFNYSEGDIIICMDDDGQNPPEEVFKLIDKLNEGYDLVSAKYIEEHQSPLRRLGTKLSFVMAEYLVGKPKGIDLNSYYVFKKYILNEIITYKNPYPFVHGLILRVTRNISNVTIAHNKREYGASGYSFGKLFALWLNGFTAFSEKPLRIASIFGFGLSFIGILCAVIIVIRKLVNPAVPLGYSSIMTTILLLNGIIMMFMGLLGEYIGRIYISLNNAPQYAIRQSINLEYEKVKVNQNEKNIDT